MSNKSYNIDQIRRKLLKQIIAGSGAISGISLLPSKWTRPIIESVVLPAHAQTSEVVFNITCRLIDTLDEECTASRQHFIVEGEVSASDGRNLGGIQLNVSYDSVPPALSGKNFTITINPDNTYALDTFAERDVGLEGIWPSNIRTITVAFIDQATYGTATCTETGTCGGIAP